MWTFRLEALFCFRATRPSRPRFSARKKYCLRVRQPLSAPRPLPLSNDLARSGREYMALVSGSMMKKLCQKDVTGWNARPNAMTMNSHSLTHPSHFPSTSRECEQRVNKNLLLLKSVASILRLLTDTASPPRRHADRGGIAPVRAPHQTPIAGSSVKPDTPIAGNI